MNRVIKFWELLTLTVRLSRLVVSGFLATWICLTGVTGTEPATGNVPGGVVLNVESPAAPPVKLATMGEASPEFAKETAQAFLKFLDLTLPEMTEVKTRADKSDWTGALDAYRDLIIDHVKEGTRQLKLGAMFPHWAFSGSEDLLAGYALIGRQSGGVSMNYLGHPGAIDWFKIGVDRVQGASEGVLPEVAGSSDRDFSTHLSTMHVFAPLADAYCSGTVPQRLQGPIEGGKSGPTAADWVGILDARPQQPSGDPKYLKAWLGTWEDFARRHKVGYAEVQKAGKLNDYNALGASQYQKFYMSCRVDQFWGQLERICQRIPKDQYNQVSGTALACVLTEIISNHVAILAKDISGAPNQAAGAVGVVMQTVARMPGLKIGPAWSDAARNQIVQYYTTINLPDGTNLEQAINYNKGNPGLLATMISLYPGRPAWIRDLEPYADKTVVYLASMLRNGSHPGALPRWGQDDRSEEKMLRDYLGVFPNEDVRKIVGRVYGPKDLGDPSFTSIQFPYSGYYMLRDGWRKEDAFCIFKASPRSNGHQRDDNTSIHLGAYGRDLLVDSGSPSYGNHPVNAYLESSFSKNTIAVDGKSQARTGIGYGNRGAIATAEHPLANRFHTSATFDFAEGVYDAGYADPKIEVRHERQIVSLRGSGLWIVIDRMRGEMTPMPAGESHTYTQVWNFDDSFAKDQVQTDEARQRVWSADPKGANVALYHFGAAPVAYKKWYGEVLPDGAQRGWIAAKNAEAKEPKVDVHAIWTGKGEQLLVTLIEARKDDKNRISAIEPLAGDGVRGFRANLPDGKTVACQAALNEAPLKSDDISMRGSLLVTLAGAAGEVRGIALDSRDWTYHERRIQIRNFEFGARDGQLLVVRDICYPEGAIPRQPGLAGIVGSEATLAKGLVARWTFNL